MELIVVNKNQKFSVILSIFKFYYMKVISAKITMKTVERNIQPLHNLHTYRLQN